MLKTVEKIKSLHARLKAWKPIHLCWWFVKHGLPVPPYLVGASEFAQYGFTVGEDVPASSDPSSVIWYGDNYTHFKPGPNRRFHLRIQVGQRLVSGSGTGDLVLRYSSPSAHPSDTTKITTTSNPRIVPSIGGVDLADGASISSRVISTDPIDENGDPTITSFVNGQYLESSDIFTSVTLGSGEFTELQVCLEFDETTPINQDYYFYLKHSDGTSLTYIGGGDYLDDARMYAVVYEEPCTFVQGHFRLGEDDPSSDKPSSITWYNDSDASLVPGKNNRFHLRVHLLQSEGTYGKAIETAIYYNTINDPSTATQITTDGNVNPVQITPSTGGVDLRDRSIVVDPFMNCSTQGSYLENSSVFWEVGLGYDCIEYQACLMFNDNAVSDQKYYFFLKHSDGTVLDTYDSYRIIEITAFQTAFLDATWEIFDEFYQYSSDLTTTWKISEHNQITVAWQRTIFYQTDWRFLARAKIDTAWNLGRYFFESKWKIFHKNSLSTSWDLGRYRIDTSWSLLTDTFDLEIEEAATQTLVDSQSNIVSLKISITGLVSKKEYRWRVRVHDLNDTGSPGNWTSWKTFTSPSLVNTVSAAWSIEGTDLHDIAYKIEDRKQANIAWLLAGADGQLLGTAWIIPEFIYPPLNPETINVDYYSARATWDRRVHWTIR